MTALNSPITSNDVIEKINELDAKELLPSPIGNSGKLLTTDGINASWMTKDYYKSLSVAQESALLSSGTYGGRTVTSGEVFVCDNGAIKEFIDTITYEDSTEALGWKLPDEYVRVSNACAFSFGDAKGVVFKNGTRELCVKENAIASNQQLSNYEYLRYFNDGSKLYRITTNNSCYRISINGESWGNESSFTTGLDSGQLSRSNFYKALGKVFAFVSKGSNEGENVAYAYANSVEGTWTVGTLPEGVSATDDCRVLVFSDEIRLLDLTTSKLYYTTDLTQGFTDSELTPTYPGSDKYFVVGDVAFYDKKHVGYSTDKGASWGTTNLGDYNYHVVYLEETQAFVALKVTTSHITTSTYYVSANGYQWTSRSSTPSLYGFSLVAGPDSAYTMDYFSYASTRIYSGARHNRSLTRLEGALPTQMSNSGKFLTTDGTNASWAAVDALPSQTGQSGKFLTTNGTTASWDTVGGSLPSQTGNAGKFLTTDGTDASWAAVSGGSVALTDIAEAGEGITFTEIPSVTQNFTVVGSPTISDGVVSGFSNNDYLTADISHTYNSGSITSFKIEIDITTGNNVTGAQRVINWTGGGGNDSEYGPLVKASSDGINLTFYTGNGNYYGFIAYPSAAQNTHYKCRWVYDGTNVKSYYKLDSDADWVLNSTDSCSTSIPRFSQTQFTIGKRDVGSTTVFMGSCNLLNFKITVNGNEEWQAYTQNTTPNYTTTGSLTITNGVASGFSANNYLTPADYHFNPGNNPWEIGLKIKTSNDVSSDQYYLNGSTDYKLPTLGMYNGNFNMLLTSNGSTWNLSSGVSIHPTANTIYWIKVIFDGSKYTFNYSTDGENFTTGITTNSSTPIYNGSSYDLNIGGTTWTGSVDLKECYIKIGDTVVWTPYAPVMSDKTRISATVSGSLPSQSGNAGKFLTTDGTNASWATVSGSGWGAPDYANASDISENPTSSNKATATADGYLVLRSSITNVDRAVYIEDVVVAYGYSSQVTACVPIAAGQQWYLNGTFQVRKFVPLK